MIIGHPFCFNYWGRSMDRMFRRAWINFIEPAARRIFRGQQGTVLRPLCQGVLLVSLLLCSGGSAYAADTGTASDPAADSVQVHVEGRFEEPDREKILERLNEIRREACVEGVRNPETGEPMSSGDYVPLEWSYELERIAAVRAVESTVLRDHIRPDGTECFTALPDSEVFSMETLAWGYGGILQAVEGWYSEKSSYVEETGQPAGHYMALINPGIRYAGAADLLSDSESDACAGAFGRISSASDSSEEETLKALQETEWEIPLKRELLSSMAERALSRVVRLFRNLSLVIR